MNRWMDENADDAHEDDTSAKKCFRKEHQETERERKESRERGSECQTATEGLPMADLKNEG